MIKLIEADGWHLVAARGSHRQYKHPANPAGDGGWQTERRLATRDGAKILKQAGLNRRIT